MSAIVARVYFISQGQLDEWVDRGNADLTGDTVSLRLNRQYLARMTPALYVTRIVSSPDDARKLVGKAFPMEVVQELGAEVMQGSVIIGDDAYDVEEGFMLSEVVPPKNEPSTMPAGAEKGRQNRGVDKSGEPELDLLASFILQRMREDHKK